MTLHGTVLGKYQIIVRLGEGGMGTVYHARDEMLDRDVAIKVLRPDLAKQSSLVERFRSEAIALARLAHPNIAALYGLERDGGQLLMIMEYVQGETLEARLHRAGPMPWRRAVDVCIDVCAALDHAHDQGVVHRDIKPANLMATPRGTIKVMDFGIARVIGRNRQTQSGRSVGTPMYMAPEQLRGEEVDGRTDIYALGAVLYELITGHLAFDADSDYTLMHKQLNDPPPAPSLRVSGVPSDVDAVVSRAMAKSPTDRFASASAMRAALQGALSETPVETTAASSAMPATRLAMEIGVPSGKSALSNERASREDRDGPPATRLVDAGDDTAHPTRLGDESAIATAPRWHLDWRTWSAAAVLLLVGTAVIRTVRRPGSPGASSAAVSAPSNSLIASASASAPTPAPSSAPGGGSQPSQQGSAAGSAGLPGAAPTHDPRLDGARALVVADETRPSRTNPSEAPKPRSKPVNPSANPPANPPTTSGRQRDGIAPFDSSGATSSPPPRDAERPRVEPDVKPAESTEAARSAVRATVSSWLAAIGTSDAAVVSAALDPSAKPHADLLTLVRERRASITDQETSAVEVNGASASTTVTTTLAYRSAFGATRKATVQFVFDLTRDGGSWRVAKARIVGSPRLN